MSSRYLCFLILIIGIGIPVCTSRAQDLNYTHYTAESGLQLPSNAAFGITFDKNNVLWATTDRGIWRYDGYSSKQFTVVDGLKENTHFRIFPDTLGWIWISSENNYLFRIIGDSVRRHPCSDSIRLYAKPSGNIQKITENPDGSIYLSYNRLGLFRFKSGEVTQKVDAHRKGHENATVAIHYTPDTFYWDMINYSKDLKKQETTVTTDNGWIYITCNITDEKNNFNKDLCPIGENEFLFSCSNKVFHIKDGQKVGEQTFLSNVISLYADKKGGFWVGFDYGGVLRYPKGDLEAAPFRYLHGESVSGITQDHEGNYWFTTTNNGIFQVNTLDITLFQWPSGDNKNNIFTSMTSDGDHIYVGTQTGLLLKGTLFENQDYHFQEMKLPEFNGPIRKLIFTREKHLIVFGNSLMEIDTFGRYQGIRKVDMYPYEYSLKPDGEWIASSSTTLRFINKNRTVGLWNAETIENQYNGDSLMNLAISRVRSMFAEEDGTIWLGSQTSGLFSYQEPAFYHWAAKDTLLEKRIPDIIKAGEDIWVSVADYGLAIIHPDSSITRITQKDGLSSDIIDVLLKENDTVVWAGTNNGLNRLTMKRGSTKPDNISYYTMSEGLPSNRIYQIIKHQNRIWFGTTLGAIRLNPDFTIPLDISPKITSGPLMVNGRARELKDTLYLNPDEDNLVFHYKAITYRKPNSLLYRFKLVGADKDYVESGNLVSRYTDLKHGKYVFCINASYRHDFNEANERKFVIYIKPHWYETPLALILFGILLAVLAFIGFRLILKAAKNREMEKRQLLLAEKRSLLSQMNPHFIFNSLNSIQHFIVQDDDFQANNYLTNFSALIRRILDNSKKNLIPLNEEISTLSLYLGMEKLRFENEFEFQIIKDHRIDFNETMIPPMLLQPFVENAIWHGLMPLKARGSLIISFTSQQDYIHCRIEDNGIGREKALLVNRKKATYVSSGIKNVQERIELLNKMNKKKITLRISDLMNPEGNASGTLVEILLPCDLKH